MPVVEEAKKKHMHFINKIVKALASYYFYLLLVVVLLCLTSCRLQPDNKVRRYLQLD